MIDEAILSDAPGHRVLLLGNEAIARGAIEAGVGVVTGYPGTPSSEILDTLFRLSEPAGLRCEYSINEKVALEVAAGAAQAGVRSMVTMKHLGLNVASDAVPTLACSGVVAGMVIVPAGDPGAHTSPNEQDHRLFARMVRLPMLDPATSEQARAMTVLAFELSEELGVPVLLRPTTRVSHTRGVVELGRRRPIETRGRLVREPSRFVPVPVNARRAIEGQPAMLAAAERRIAEPPWTVTEGTGARLGVVSNGVAACYVREAIADLGAAEEVTHLQVGSSAPLPAEPCREVLRRCDTLLVVEELMPAVEEQLRSLAHEVEGAGRVLGKLTGAFPYHGEYGPALVRPALARALGRAESDAPAAEVAPAPGPLPPRPPVLCAGCPHRSTFAAVRLVFDAEHTAFVNDIGCYTLGFAPPLGAGDFLLCMGSSITQASGMASALEPDEAVAFIGDGTFYHSGMTGLLNAVTCGHDVVICVLDNGTTAMTGHQPNPGIADERGYMGSRASMEAVIRGLGVEHLFVVDPMDLPATVSAMRQAHELKGVRVILSQHRCPVDVHRLEKSDPSARLYTILQERCQACPTREKGMPCSVEPDRALGTLRVLRALESPEAGKHEVAPCAASCPLGVCVPGYTALLGAGRVDDSAALVRERNPLPSVCSRVCHAPCEDGCVRASDGQALAANALKRVALDRGKLPVAERPEEMKDRTVGVVGSGPAGLACADELARRGYPVTIYESAPEPGGMLRRAIPPYRLPREVLDRDVASITAVGVEIRCGVAVGEDVALSELTSTHDAVFLGVGAWVGRGLEVPGGELDGATDSLSFLESALSPSPPRLAGRRVVVIGGGDAAVDCARMAVRLGAEEVTLAYRRGREEMPAEGFEIEGAEAEGVTLHLHARPLRAEGTAGRLERLVCLRTAPGGCGADGRRTPCDVPDSEHELPADLVVTATGQRVDGSLFRGGGLELDTSGWGTLEADPTTLQTSHPRIFAGGDAVTGPATVVDAMAAGKRAAWSIDVALARSDEEVLPCPVPDPADVKRDAPPATCTEEVEQGRPHVPERPAGERRGDMEEIMGCLDQEVAEAEARRCLGCSPCAACDVCMSLLGCPAIIRGRDGRPRIDDVLCNGCGLCAAICPSGAIVEVER